MKPWEIEIPKNHDASSVDHITIPLWNKFKAKDFYFAMQHNKDDDKIITIVYITPAEYFEENAYMWTDSIPLMHLIPNYLIEIMESIYETEAHPDKVLGDMLAIGFVRDNNFQKFIDAESTWTS